MKHAVINNQNEVVNTVEWDGVSPWRPSQGHFVIQADHANIGDVYDPQTKMFIAQSLLLNKGDNNG